MTNREKFKETFGFNFDSDSFSNCLAPEGVCRNYDSCEECPFDEFWDKEYKSCFKLKEEFDD